MKNKKIILITVLLVILSVTLLSFTACNKEKGFDINGLTANAPQAYKTQSKITNLDALNEYPTPYIYDNFLFATGSTEDGKCKFCLYSLAEQKVLTEGVAPSFDRIATSDNYGMFFLSVVEEDGSMKYSYYDIYGEIVSFDTDVTAVFGSNDTGFKYANLSDYSYILIDETGKGTHIPYSIKPQLSRFTAIGDYLQVLFSSDAGEQIYLVYDRELNFVTSYDMKKAFDVSSSMSLSLSKTIDCKFYRAYTETVTDEDADYDYIDTYGQKVNLSQFVLDISTGKTTTLSNDIVIKTFVDSSTVEGYFFAYYSRVYDKAISTDVRLGLFDENFNFVADISDIIGSDDTVASVEKVGDALVFVSPQYFTFVKNNKVAYKVASSYGSTVVYSRYVYGRNIYFDLFTGKSITQIPADAVLQSTTRETDGLIYYKVNEEIENESGLSYVYRTYVFDVKTGQTTLIDDSDKVTFDSTGYFYKITDTEASTTSFYDVFSNKPIVEDLDYNFLQINYIADGVILSFKDAEGNVSRYSIQLS